MYNCIYFLYFNKDIFNPPPPKKKREPMENQQHTIMIMVNGLATAKVIIKNMIKRIREELTPVPKMYDDEGKKLSTPRTNNGCYCRAVIDLICLILSVIDCVMTSRLIHTSQTTIFRHRTVFYFEPNVNVVRI